MQIENKNEKREILREYIIYYKRAFFKDLNTYHILYLKI